MTKVLELHLLGSLQINLDGRPFIGLVSSKAKALLCYLAVTGRPHTRQALAGLLWPDLPEADARRNLRGDLLKLRQVIPDHLLVTRQTLAFNPESDYWLDVALFQRETAVSSETAVTDAIIAQYRGGFLEDLHIRRAPAFEQWTLQERTRLRELFLAACHRLAAAHADNGQLEKAILCARRLLAADPIREESHRLLMRLLAQNNQRSLALAQHEQCRAILAEELGVAPMPETLALVEQIKAGEKNWGTAARPPAVVGGRGDTISSPRPKVVIPFIAGPPISHPRHFFGRERELKRLFSLVKRPPLQNAAIIGSRRSGKTSLLHYLRRITAVPATDLRPGQRQDWLSPAAHRWIFVDFQDPRLGKQSNLLNYLLAQMGLPTPTNCGMEQFMDVVSQQLDTPTVVLLDEIGVALSRYPELDDAFWESLRALATNLVDGSLGFVLASAEPPSQLAQSSGLGSPFFNIFGYTAALGPLTEPEAWQLMASSPQPFAESDMAWILAESGRWPMLLQILCRERLMSLIDGETGDGWREEARRQIAPFLNLLTPAHS